MKRKKSAADLRLCLESDVMILEMSGKKSTLVLKFLRVAFFFVSCNNPEDTKEVKQGNISASFLFCSVTFYCLGKNQKHWCTEKKRKRSFVQIWSQEKSQYQINFVGIFRGICYALLICIYLITTKNNPHLYPEP